MRKSSAITQIIGGQLITVVGAVQGIVLVPMCLTYLGRESYGAWISTVGVIALMGVLDLGISNVISRRVAYAHGAGDHDELARVMKAAFTISIGLFLVLATVGLITAEVLPRYFAYELVGSQNARVALRLSAVEIAMSGLFNMTGAVLFGLQRPRAHMIGAVAGIIVAFTVSAVLLRAGIGFLALAIGGLSRALFSIVCDIIGLLKVFERSYFVRIAKSGARYDGVMAGASWLVPTRICELGFSQLENSLVQVAQGSAQVADLAVTRKSSDLSLQAVARLPASLGSGLAHLRGSGKNTQARLIVGRLFLASSYLAAVSALIVYCMNSSFVSLWTNPESHLGGGADLVLAVYVVLRVFRSTSVNVLFAYGRVRSLALAAVVELLVQALMGVILSRYLGATGVLIASAIAVLVGAVLLVKGLRDACTPNLQIVASRAARVLCSTAVAGTIWCLLAPVSDTWFRLALHSAELCGIFIVAALIAEWQLFKELFNAWRGGH